MPELEAKVLKAGVEAARLTSDGKRTRFEYLPNYLASSLPAVATSLPKSLSPIELPGGAAPAYFAGLLPEGRRLVAVAQRIKSSLDNDLALLIELGQDPVGDVQIIAEARTIESMALPLDTSSVSFRELRETWFGSSAGSIPGVQDKVSSRMLNARARRAMLEYIVKFNPVDVPFAVENEFYFLQLAKSAGLKVAGHELLTDRDGEHALLLERFDRHLAEDGLIRLAMEDGAQVLGLYPSAKYDVSFSEVTTALLEHVPAKQAAALELFRQIAFAWLTGNGDAHAKNFAMLKTPSGEWRISPAYDLLCTAFFGDRTMALELGGNNSGWKRETLLQYAQQCGLPGRLANLEIEKLLNKLKDLPTAILSGALPYRRDQNIEVSNLLKKRARAITNPS